MTQTDLANAIGVKKESVSNMEKGKTSLSFPRVIDLCKALKITIYDLLIGTDLMKDKVIERYSVRFNELNETYQVLASQMIDIFLEQQKAEEEKILRRYDIKPI